MSDKKVIFKLTKNGERAIESEIYTQSSPLLTSILKRFNRKEGFLETDFSADEQQYIKTLAEVGLLESHVVSDESQIKSKAFSKIHVLKKKLVEILKEDLSDHEKFWDMLLNLETITEKDGLLWFMSQVTHFSETPKKPEYKSVFKELMELENG